MSSSAETPLTCNIALRPQWPSLEVGFQRFRTKEAAAWKASGCSPDSRSRLVPPSGSLESKVAHYLHQPSFTTKSGPDGDTADLSNPCTAMVIGHGFRQGETLMFDHIFRQDEKSEGLKNYPPQVLQAHEDFAYDILASTHSVVVVIYGSHVQERILRSWKIKKTVVPLWGEYSDVLLVLIHESSFENEEKHYRFRSIVVLASHPQYLFYQPKDGSIAKRQDKTLKAAFRIADHTIQFDEDYYRSQKWRDAISELMKAHYLQPTGLAVADRAPELLSLKEPIVDLQEQANDPGGNSRRDFGKWASFFNPRPHSNDTLRKLLPRAIEATKPAYSQEWLSFSDCDLDTQEWLKGNGPILFYDQPISSVEDVSKVLVRCMEANDRSNRIPLVKSMGLRAMLNELMQIQEAALLKETRVNQDLWHGRFDGQIIDIVCPCGELKSKDTRPGFACRRNSAYIRRGKRCSECLGRIMKPVEDIESVLSGRNSLLSYVPVSETTRRGERYASLLRSSKDDGPTCPAAVKCWCIICQEDTELAGGGVVYLDSKARWTLGFKRPLYVERQIICLHCKNGKGGRFVPIDKNIPSINTKALGLFEAKFGTLSKTIIAAVLDNWPPSCRESRFIRIAADEESHENRVGTPLASHPNPQSTSWAVSPTQFTSAAKSTVIPSTQYPSSGTITANLATSKTVATIPIEELEVRQVVQTTEDTKTTQVKKRGRPPSKDRQLRKKRAKKAPEQEGE